MIDFTQILIYFGIAGVALLLGLILGSALISSFIPGAWVWLMAGFLGDIPVLEISATGQGKFISAMIAKTATGAQSLFLRITGKRKVVNPMAIANKTKGVVVGGKHMLMKLWGDAQSIYPEEVASINTIQEHIEKNRKIYPKISALQEFEWYEAVSMDEPTFKELMRKYCPVNRYKKDAKGALVEKTDKEIEEEEKPYIETYTAEQELLKTNLSHVLRPELFRPGGIWLDVGRAAASRQLGITDQAFNAMDLETKEAANKTSNKVGFNWGSAAIGGSIGMILGAALLIVALKFIGGQA